MLLGMVHMPVLRILSKLIQQEMLQLG
jgi:hypothetical protein